MIKKLLLSIIWLYQQVSKYTPARCRFYPTCSEYAKESIIRFGIFKGLFLAAKRIVKCHPLNEGGYDPVPEVYSCFQFNNKK